MGINITEIGQKVLDNNANAANVFRKQYDLHYNSTPMDVEIPWVDENGNTVTAKIPNVASFRKRVWDDVGGALGQLDKVIYLDPVNGDDNNTGTSKNNAFKTLKKAISATARKSIVYILNDLEIKASEEVQVVKKHIAFRSHPDNEDVKILFNIDAAAFCLSFYHDSYAYFKIDCKVENNYDSAIRIAVNADSNCFVRTYINYAKSKNNNGNISIKLDISDNAAFIKYRNSAGGFEETNITTTNTKSYICAVAYTAQIYFSATCKINGETLSTNNVKNKVIGIVKDADSGNPINIISNINFSD